MTLLPHHLQSLAVESKISPQVIEARGYQSLTQKSDLESYGFSQNQRRTPTLLIPVWNASDTDTPSLYSHRPDPPRQSKEGKPVKYEFPARSRMCFDVHPFIRQKVRDPKTPLLITEGSKKADAAISAGLCCIALLGVWNWRGKNEFDGMTTLPDFDLLAWKDAEHLPRQVYICFDSDVMLKPAVYKALVRLAEQVRLRGAEVLFLYLPTGDGKKTGLDDYLAAGHSTADLFALATPELREGPDQDKSPPSTAQLLIDLGMKAELFLSDRGEPFARFTVSGHKETHRIRSKTFRNWLYYAFRKQSGKIPNAQAVDDALHVLEGHATFEGPTRPLAVRVARDETGAIWIDLADKERRAVRITPEGWNVFAEPPTLFHRFSVAAAQPQPVSGGSIEALRDYLNLRDDNGWYQVVVWLVAAFIPEIAHPILIVHGEQGSAKSTLQKLLCQLIDPSKTPLRTQPHDKNAWMQQADHSWALMLDNISDLSRWLSDALCRAVTGDGDTKRQLFTDDEDFIYEFRRVIGLNGIEAAMQQPDVLNRALLLPLEPIAPEDRKSETAVLTEFERLRPSLFGALLDILTRTLRELPQVKLDTVPRMADFARVGVAVERALGWEAGTFLRAYTANIAEQHMEALAASPVAETIITFMEERPNWEGTAGNLLDELTALIGETKAKAKDWPKTPRGLAGHLKRIAPNLRGVGIWVKEATPQGHDRKRVLSIVNKSLSPESRGIQPSASSAPSVPISNEQESADDWPLMRTVDRPQASQPSAGQSSFQSQADDADDADGSAATFSNTALDDLEGDGPEMEL